MLLISAAGAWLAVDVLGLDAGSILGLVFSRDAVPRPPVPDAGVAAAPVPPPMPWQDEPPVDQWIAACRTAVVAVPAAIPGWPLQEAECDGHTVRAVWRRTTGQVAWLAAAVPRRGDADARARLLPDLDLQGTIARVVVALPPPAPARRAEEPWPRAAVVRVLHGLAVGGSSATLAGPVVPPVLPGAPVPPPAPAALAWTLEGRLDPRDWAALLMQVPATVLHSLQWSADRGWRIASQTYYETGGQR